MRILFLVFTMFICRAESTAQQTPETLAQKWVAAIREHSLEKLIPLIHPNCPKDSLESEILERMIAGELPKNFRIEIKDLGPIEALEKVYLVTPSKQLNLRYITSSIDEKKKYGLGKGYPIAEDKGQWYFTVCAKKK